MEAKGDDADGSLPGAEKVAIDTVEKPVKHVEFSPFWNLDTVIIQAQNTLFNVPKQVLDVPGTMFADMFAVPPTDDKPLEGESTTNPIVLSSKISAHDFDAFLRMLLSPFNNPVSGYSQFLGVLSLAHKWKFQEIREKAIQALTPLIPDAGTKVHLGKQFLVQDWLRQGLIDIVEDLDLEPEDLFQSPYRFDTNYTSKIFFIQKDHLREDNLKAKRICQFCQLQTVSNSGHCSRNVCGRSQKYVPIAERVERVFKDELVAHTFGLNRLSPARSRGFRPVLDGRGSGE